MSAYMLISKDIKFEAAHHLNNYEGQCARVHGHSYTGKVWIQGSVDEIGLVVDFNKIKELINYFDHQDLNELDEFKDLNPTAENIANVILRKLNNLGQFAIAVKLHETASSYVFISNTHDQYFISTLSV